MARGDVTLNPYLVSQVIRDLLATPLFDDRDVTFREPCTIRHGHEHAVDAEPCHQSWEGAFAKTSGG